MGFMRRETASRFFAAIAVALVIGRLSAPAYAEKIGVAAAVNPDAFSNLGSAPQTQINIGKSIFYNERINTTGSGLVQVLLVDGSTFTVGPGSDLVIDKFVYDPKKGAGQISASFSKGVMRFVGGKISKNEGGVTVNTPAGALAIRGAIALADFKSPKVFSILFVFGEYLKLQDQAPIFQYPYGYFANNGQITTREYNAADLKTIMASLTNGNSGGNNSGNNPPSPPKPMTTQSLSQLIANATATQIQSQVDNPPSTLYAAGMYLQTEIGGENDSPVGGLVSLSPTTITFNGTSFAGADFALFVVDGGGGGGNCTTDCGGGGAKIHFVPVEIPPELQIPPGLQGLPLFAGIADQGSITVYDQTDKTTDPPTLTSPETLNSGQAFLVGTQGGFCTGCDFLTWGLWGANLDFQNPNSENQVRVAGWWISGDITSVDKLAALGGEATYNGHVIGNVANNPSGEGWQTYVATGDLTMHWNFGDHNGDLTISKFDTSITPGGLTFSGPMCATGATCGDVKVPAGNQFGGELTGSLPTGPPLTGGAVGSFVKNGSDPVAGVIGNWAIGTPNDSHAASYYSAAGIFGGVSTPSLAGATH
jgi:FecR protein